MLVLCGNFEEERRKNIIRQSHNDKKLQEVRKEFMSEGMAPDIIISQ